MKCKPEDVPAEAVEEYAKAICAAAASTCDWFVPWGEVKGPERGWMVAARRAIADGAEPEGWWWTWDPAGCFALARKFPPKPEPTEVEKARELALAAIKANAPMPNAYNSKDIALLAYIDAVAKAVKS